MPRGLGADGERGRGCGCEGKNNKELFLYVKVPYSPFYPVSVDLRGALPVFNKYLAESRHSCQDF